MVVCVIHSPLLAVLNVVLPEMRVARRRRGRTTFKVVYIMFVEAAVVLVSTTVFSIPTITTGKEAREELCFSPTTTTLCPLLGRPSLA